jgi:hypothetical protein
MNRILLCIAAMTAGITVAATATPHHSTVAIYDGNRTVEITGVVNQIHWRNPHGQILLDVRDPAGNRVQWEVETPAIVVLRILGIGRDFIAPGDRITIAGAPARRDPSGMNASNILLASGYELAFGNNAPHFDAGRNGNLIGRSYDDSNVDEAIASADRIYRVWSTNMGDPAAFPMFKGGYPLTPAADAVVAEWDPLDNDLLRCGTKGMPLIMITPAPVEFVRQGESILMRIEEYDSRRTIHMNPDMVVPDEHTQMGFSRGRFEGNTLVVETGHIQAQYFDPNGVPQSESMTLVERFTPSPDYTRLDYQITVTDPVYFSEPFSLTRYFVWRPEMEVAPYNCLERDWTVD